MTNKQLKQLKRLKELPIVAAFLKEQDEFTDLFGTVDTAEGLAAFIEKRNPNFSGT